jgi:hypothetical protein
VPRQRLPDDQAFPAPIWIPVATADNNDVRGDASQYRAWRNARGQVVVRQSHWSACSGTSAIETWLYPDGAEADQALTRILAMCTA